MSIQEGVNKALGIGAVLATQSPLMENQKIKAAKKSEVKRLNTQAKLLDDKAESLQAKARAESLQAKDKGEDYHKNFFDEAAYKETNRQLREVNRRLFELNPTTKTSADYYSTFTFKELKKQMDDLKRMDDANIQAEYKGYGKKVQNKAFKVLKESKKNGKT